MFPINQVSSIQMKDYNLDKEAEQKYLQEVSDTELVKQKILMSRQQLITLAHRDQKLYRRINELNHLGVESIIADKFDHALLYLQECEGILQYVASCGRTIDIGLILTVLSNQACAYQRKSMIEKAADYVEAIIYNLNLFLEAPENAKLLHQLEDISNISEEYPSANDFLQKSYLNIKSVLMKKYQLAVYLLQFSGLNSQNQKHEQSLQNAKKSLLAMKEFMRYCLKYQSLISNFSTPIGTYLIKQLSELPERFYWWERNKYTYQLKRLREKQINHQIPYSVSQQIENTIKSINLNTFFIIQPKQIPQNNCLLADISINNFNIQMCSSDSFYLRTVLFFSVAYFAISAQIQQINNMEDQNQNDYSNLIETSMQNKAKIANRQQQKKEGELYHVMSLILGYKLIPFSTNLIEYLFGLYTENYHYQVLALSSYQQNMAGQKDSPDNFISELPSINSIVFPNYPHYNRLGQYSDLIPEKSKEASNELKININCAKGSTDLRSNKIISIQSHFVKKNPNLSNCKERKSLKKKIRFNNLNNICSKRQIYKQNSKYKIPLLESKKSSFVEQTRSKTGSRFVKTVSSQSDRTLKSKSKSKQNKEAHCLQQSNKIKKCGQQIKKIGQEKGEKLKLASNIKDKVKQKIIASSIKMNKVKSPTLKRPLRNSPEEKVYHSSQCKDLATKSTLNINRSESNRKNWTNSRSKSTHNKRSLITKRNLSKTKLSKEKRQPSIYLIVQNL